MYITIVVCAGVALAALAIHAVFSLTKRAYASGMHDGMTRENGRILQEFCKEVWVCVHMREGVVARKFLVRQGDGVHISLNPDCDFDEGERILLSRRLHAHQPQCPLYAGGLEAGLTYERLGRTPSRDDD